MNGVNTLALDGEETLQRLVNGDLTPVREGHSNVRRVYIAGPMRGYVSFNFPAFAAAAAELRAAGYEVVSPHEHDLDDGFDPTGMTGWEDLAAVGFNLRDALAWDLDQVTHVDGVYFLPGWERSSGARAEMAAACAVGNYAATGMDEPWLSAKYLSDTVDLETRAGSADRLADYMGSTRATFLTGPHAGRVVILRAGVREVVVAMDDERTTVRNAQGEELLRLPEYVNFRLYSLDGKHYLSADEPELLTHESGVILDADPDWRVDDRMARFVGEGSWPLRVEAEKRGLSVVWSSFAITVAPDQVNGSEGLRISTRALGLRT